MIIPEQFKTKKKYEIICGSCGNKIEPQDKPCSHCFPKELPIPDGLPRMPDGNLYPILEEDDTSRSRRNIGS